MTTTPKITRMLKVGDGYTARLFDLGAACSVYAEPVAIAHGAAADYEITWVMDAPRVWVWRDGRRGQGWAEITADAIEYGRGICSPSEAERAEIEALAPQVRALPRRRWGYIRYGRLPRGGRSTNHATGLREAGVSCYEARTDVITGAWQICGGGLPTAAILAAHGCYGDVTLLLDGVECGRGSDGEPLLRRARVLAHLIPSPDGDGYVEAAGA